MIDEHIDFVNREALAIALARKISHVLSRAVTVDGSAVLALSGGTTPALFFEHLSKTPISWDKVTVTLVDERQVPDDSPRSNARLVKEYLLRDRAGRARFVPLYKNPAAARLPEFAACVLGMGSDGHTASFFPGGDTLSNAIDPHTDKRLLEISAPTAGEPRLTFTLPVLAQSGFLALQIEGREKREVLDRALGPGAIAEMPVRAVLKLRTPLHVFWCP